MAFLSSTRHTSRPAPSLRTSFLELMSVYRQRRALARLDDAALKDMGITRADALAESRRHFWDLP